MSELYPHRDKISEKEACCRFGGCRDIQTDIYLMSYSSRDEDNKCEIDVALRTPSQMRRELRDVRLGAQAEARSGEEDGATSSPRAASREAVSALSHESAHSPARRQIVIREHRQHMIARANANIDPPSPHRKASSVRFHRGVVTISPTDCETPGHISVVPLNSLLGRSSATVNRLCSICHSDNSRGLWCTTSVRSVCDDHRTEHSSVFPGDQLTNQSHAQAILLIGKCHFASRSSPAICQRRVRGRTRHRPSYRACQRSAPESLRPRAPNNTASRMLCGIWLKPLLRAPRDRSERTEENCQKHTYTV